MDSVGGGLGVGMLYWGSDLNGQVGGLPVGIRSVLSYLGVVPVDETFLVLSIVAGPWAGNLWWVESQLLAGVACSTRSQVHSMLSEGGGGGHISN